MLSDGSTWVHNLCGDIFPDAQHILNYFHLCENVYLFAQHLFNMDEAKYKSWAEDVCKALKKSKANQVLKELLPFKDKKPMNCSINLYGYITNNIKNIDYAKYLEIGYIIGSTAQHLLTLISKEESDLWNSDVLGSVLNSIS